MPPRRRRGRRGRRRKARLRSATLVVLASLALVLVAGWLYVRHVRREVESTWSRHTSSAPSRVFARPLDLYPGRALDRATLLAALGDRGYRRAVGSGAPAPGEIHVLGSRILVGLHDFAYPPPEGRFEGFPLSIRENDGRIGSLRDLSADTAVYDVRLEPLEVATLLDRRMVLRTPVELSRVPAVVTQAVLSVEDRRFFHHGGVDLVRIAGAALHDLTRGRLEQGGSTLTQQLVKNFYLSPARTLRRKVTEAIMAVVLEREHDKADILEAYLNEVYLGQRGPVSIVGVQEAARHYFSRDVNRLDLAQAALLAGLIQSPARYDPFRHPEAARRRRSVVLGLMEAQGRIGREERARAEREPLPGAARERPVDAAPYFVDYVERELSRRYPDEALTRRGLRVFTTLDPRAQAAAREAVERGLASLEASHPKLRQDGEGALQAALVAMDPRTGDVLALVGGRSYGATQFNRAVDARRQPGSLYKPFVYLTALEDTTGGWTLGSRVADSALHVDTEQGVWSPSNYDGREHGLVTLHEALVHSYNLASARLGMDVGLSRVVATARALGVGGRLRPVPSLSLGAFESTPLEMASAYAALAGGGIRPDPLSVLGVVGADGAALEARPLRMDRVAPAGPVYLVDRALQDVLVNGTAARARSLGYAGHAAGKTGTSSDYRDAWFAGFTPSLVTVVWVGFDDNRSLGLPGSGAALPIWVRFVDRYGDGSAGRPAEATFPAPAGVVSVTVDSATGRLPRPACGPTREEVFLEGTAPSSGCRSVR